MNTLEPAIAAAATVIALTTIAAAAILAIRIAVRGTPGTHRAGIIHALADLTRALRGR
ncbi:hypothetical protein ACFQU9_14075 [Actinomadura namibiensis]|uniref:Uncharacterized protein n=1 Tax=Actinomadura namibiensis TaxID=182080 RepID=A0A7W3QRK8_ACTNM|nr:hypothetical protein [Actinomadura namibiensis]MBA8956890.1 hypothetical protein [Actinomadura namibiensis]